MRSIRDILRQRKRNSKSPIRLCNKPRSKHNHITPNSIEVDSQILARLECISHQIQVPVGENARRAGGYVEAVNEAERRPAIRADNDTKACLSTGGDRTPFMGARGSSDGDVNVNFEDAVIEIEAVESEEGFAVKSEIAILIS